MLARQRKRGSRGFTLVELIVVMVILGMLAGLVALWDAGLHPAVVEAIHVDLTGLGGPPLPEVVYLGALGGRQDLAWVADTLAAVEQAAAPDTPKIDFPAPQTGEEEPSAGRAIEFPAPAAKRAPTTVIPLMALEPDIMGYAEDLGMQRSHLYKKIEKYGLK